MTILLLILTAIICYAVGNVSGAMLLTRLWLKKKRGKYSASESKVLPFYKDFGTLPTVVLGIVEILRAVLCALIGGWLLGIVGAASTGRLFGIFCLILGECYPFLFLFKGGKGLLSAGIAAFVVDWRVGLCCVIAYVVVIIFSRYAALGAVIAAVLSPILLWAFEFSGIDCTLALLCALLIILSHGENLLNIFKGTEPRSFEFIPKHGNPAFDDEEEVNG